MTLRVSILATYALALLLIGWLTRSRWNSSPSSYFLADRGLGTLVLAGTMLATNFSAFTVFGCSGAGYRDGFAFYPIMGFGTGFMALSFWLLGRRIWKLGLKHKLITPPELVEVLYHSRLLKRLFALVMVCFTLPYLALQPMAAGYALEELVGLPYHWGVCLLTLVVLLYTLRGGLRAVAWTDLLQGALLLFLLVAALLLLVAHHGGPSQAGAEVFSQFPELFSRPGGQGRYTPGIWFSYLLLWFLCDPMFPQLFQRFYAARSQKGLANTMLLYPLVCSLVFLLPVSIGVLGRLQFPALAGKEADRILPMLMNSVGGDTMAALVVAAGLAALMSTMDSQLLTLGSIFSRDLLPQSSALRRSGASGRVAAIVLALAGMLLALHPPGTILAVATQTFTGLAVLFPIVAFGLYLPRRYPLAGILSLLCGEGLLILFHFGLLQSGAVLPVVWIVATSSLVYLLCHGVLELRRGLLRIALPKGIHIEWWLLAGVFVLAQDFWNWQAGSPSCIGLPLWIGWFLLLSGLQIWLSWRLVGRYT